MRTYTIVPPLVRFLRQSSPIIKPQILIPYNFKLLLAYPGFRNRNILDRAKHELPLASA